ncbi:MAG: phosphotransferase [Streptomyces sp.]|uniref:phosphotransferase n=1 Tax=Streptomyces sp. TaxID=1931 RepID=UPI003D6AE556
MTSHAFQQAARTGTVDGPLRGYHREWYVVQPSGELADLGRVKVGEPRENVLWFDRRCFPAEEQLLLRLSDLGMPGVPPVRSFETLRLVVHGFVEGQTLSERSPAGMTVEKPHLAQIMAIFGELARVRPSTVTSWGIHDRTDDVREGDSRAFLQSLIRFTHEHVYTKRRPEFGQLFDQLGIPATALEPHSWLMAEAGHVSARPFCLLHGDLHRANFIVDPTDRIWTIDWELAALGDPLYDLATHLHLMCYPPGQEREVTEQWCTTMLEALPGAVSGLERDLPRYLAYKRAQSVYTDVVRHAIAVRNCATPDQRANQLYRTAKALEHVLTRAEQCLRLRTVPDPWAIESAYANFCSAT